MSGVWCLVSAGVCVCVCSRKEKEFVLLYVYTHTELSFFSGVFRRRGNCPSKSKSKRCSLLLLLYMIYEADLWSVLLKLCCFC